MKDYTMFEIERLVPNFFSKGAKKFFNSKINMQQFAKYGFFITSEKFDENSERLYSIRQFCYGGTTSRPTNNTVSDFQEFSSLGKAQKELAKIIKLIEIVKNDGCFLENTILNTMHYVNKENGLYCFYAFMDAEQEDEKVLKLDTKNMRYTF